MCERCYDLRYSMPTAQKWEYDRMMLMPLTQAQIAQIENNNQLTNNKKTMIKSLKGLMSRLLDADTQTLYKADYINGDLELTDSGRKKLLELLFLANKVELVKLANEELLAEEKKK